MEVRRECSRLGRLYRVVAETGSCGSCCWAREGPIGHTIQSMLASCVTKDLPRPERSGMVCSYPEND
jgi:hypothetical protein